MIYQNIFEIFVFTAIKSVLCFAKQALTVSEIEREFHRMSFDSSGVR